MNEKKCKKMRKHARLVCWMNPTIPYKAAYKAIKKGARNEAKLARFRATSNQPIKCTPLIYKEAQDDTHDK